MVRKNETFSIDLPGAGVAVCAAFRRFFDNTATIMIFTREKPVLIIAQSAHYVIKSRCNYYLIQSHVQLTQSPARENTRVNTGGGGLRIRASSRAHGPDGLECVSTNGGQPVSILPNNTAGLVHRARSIVRTLTHYTAEDYVNS